MQPREKPLTLRPGKLLLAVYGDNWCDSLTLCSAFRVNNFYTVLLQPGRRMLSTMTLRILKLSDYGQNAECNSL